MREKDFQERINELKEKYVGVNDFDFKTVIDLEDEYNDLSEKNPEHTTRRKQILDMRERLIRTFKTKDPKAEYHPITAICGGQTVVEYTK